MPRWLTTISSVRFLSFSLGLRGWGVSFDPKLDLGRSRKPDQHALVRLPAELLSRIIIYTKMEVLASNCKSMSMMYLSLLRAGGRGR
jgi:hypothetical protein